MSLPYYDLLDEILQPTRHNKPELESVLIDRAMKAYRVNKPQAAAILGAMSTLGFSLIQGPPGTGKTKTILGLVGAFISNRGKRATGISVGQSSGQLAPAEKMLVCAPSNAAVDEIAKRLKDGVYDSEGRKFVPKVVRVGAESAVHPSVSDIFLDTLVEKVLGGSNGKTAAGEAQAKMATARTELQSLRSERDDKRAEKANVVNNTALLSKLNSEISRITQRINDLGDQLDRERDKLTQSNRAMETTKRKARADILANADVICSTLSGAGHDYLASFDFETVIIDEAAQSVEISSLIPLRYNCQRCIMVGGTFCLHAWVVQFLISCTSCLFRTVRSESITAHCQISRSDTRWLQQVSLRALACGSPGSHAPAFHTVSYAPRHQHLPEQSFLRVSTVRRSKHGCSNETVVA
jgi:senataxin